MPFTGRSAELAELAHQLEPVRLGGRTDQGTALLLRGRRRVGKSSLVTEFVKNAGVPSMYFQAARGATTTAELAHLAELIAASDLPNADVAQDNQPATLTAALSLLATALPADTPSIVVIDEAPWLLESIPGGAGELQRVWDRQLARKPVLLILLGSDLAMMEELSKPNQPFHGRATEMILNALNPHDVATMTGLDPVSAFDAYLITGGLPMIVQEWTPGTTRSQFLKRSFERSTSALVVSGLRILDSEFSADTYAREVLSAIGGRGERTFTGITHDLGGTISATTLNKSLGILSTKRVIAAESPLSTRTALKDKRWRVTDPGLAFWLTYVQPSLGAIDRGRPDIAIANINSGFEAWRGRAIEPIIRDALQRLLPDPQFPNANLVGGWWPRNNNPEIDLVAANKLPAKTISFIGSIKWRNKGTISGAAITDLATNAIKVPGANAATPLVVVCPTTKSKDPRIAKSWTAKDLLAAWPSNALQT